MKSSQNSETQSSNRSPEHFLEAPITRRRFKRSFESFGMLFEYVVVQETMPAWQQTKVSDDPTRVEWTLTGAMKTTEYVDTATVRSPKSPDAGYGRHITLFTTSEGPILALVQDPRATYVGLRHPALVQYAGGMLKLKPLFGADREMHLSMSAILATTTPNEALLAAYAGFILQNNMGGFAQKLPRPLHTHEEEITPRCT